MPTGTPKAATRAQIARYGHVASALRGVMKQRGWDIGDFNEAIGQERLYTPTGKWLGAKSAPGPKLRPIVSQVTGIPQARLVKRRPEEAAASKALTVVPPKALVTRASPTATRPRLVFAVLQDATLEEGAAFLRKLLDGKAP